MSTAAQGLLSLGIEPVLIISQVVDSKSFGSFILILTHGMVSLNSKFYPRPQPRR
jgi:hypothetical protein